MLDEAVTMLGEHIVLAHGKDRAANGEVRPAGLGIVPWARFFGLLRAAGYGGPLIVHGLDVDEITSAVHHLERAVELSADALDAC